MVRENPGERGSPREVEEVNMSSVEEGLWYGANISHQLHLKKSKTTLHKQSKASVQCKSLQFSQHQFPSSSLVMPHYRILPSWDTQSALQGQ